MDKRIWTQWPVLGSRLEEPLEVVLAGKCTTKAVLLGITSAESFEYETNYFDI